MERNNRQSYIHSLFLFLINSDPAIKQFIVYLNAGEFRFGMVELDDTHIFLHSTDDSIIQRIQQKIDELQDENTYTAVGAGGEGK